MTRTTSLVHGLQKLIELGVQIDNIIDIGIQSETHFLKTCFPACFHHLFEADEKYAGDIEANYSRIRHETHFQRVGNDYNLDSHFSTIPPNLLVKIDVDGSELEAIDNCRAVIASASIVIVEATIVNLSARLNAIESLGLRLWGVCDLSYFHGVLSQVDLVFAAPRLFSDHELDPWQIHKLDYAHYSTRD